MKRAIIIHCWEGYPNYCWYPDTRKGLEELGFTVEVPGMPEPDKPLMSTWVPKLTEVVGTPDTELYLIGHSIGAVTIMRYLETLPDNVQIGGVVLVAGFTDDLGYKELENFFQTKMDFEKIKARAKKFVLINSDNDPYVQMIHGDMLKSRLGAELIIKKGMKHFSGAADDEKACLSLPDVAEAIKAMS